MPRACARHSRFCRACRRCGARRAPRRFLEEASSSVKARSVTRHPIVSMLIKLSMIAPLAWLVQVIERRIRPAEQGLLPNELDQHGVHHVCTLHRVQGGVPGQANTIGCEFVGDPGVDEIVPLEAWPGGLRKQAFHGTKMVSHALEGGVEDRQQVIAVRVFCNREVVVGEPGEEFAMSALHVLRLDRPQRWQLAIRSSPDRARLHRYRIKQLSYPVHVPHPAKPTMQAM